jgi:hypothetical protein
MRKNSNSHRRRVAEEQEEPINDSENSENRIGVL